MNHLPFPSPPTRRSSTAFAPRALLSCLLLGGGFLFAAAPAARASFHVMQIEQIIGGVNGDTTAQAVELRMRAPGQRYLHSDAGGTHGPAGLVVYDASGANPVTLITFPNDVPNGVAGGRVLVASPNFSGHFAPAATPDFIMANPIPAAYLAAGRLDYVDGGGGVLWSVSFGGANYQGPVVATTLNGSFGAPFAGPLPTAGTAALQFQGLATAPGTGNAADYRVTAPGAVFVNNAGASFALSPDVPALGQISVTALKPRVSEAGAGHRKGILVVSRTGDTASDLTVHYKAGGSAMGGAQYQELAGTVLIPAGAASARILVIPIRDGVKQGDTVVKVTLKPGIGYDVGAPRKALVTILDAD